MKMIEYFNLFLHDVCVDTSDDVYDTTVTIDFEKGEEPNNYSQHLFKFKMLLLEKVEIKGINESIYGNIPICKYTALIENNIDLFREFALENFDNYDSDEDDDDFYYNFIQEFHKLLAGYGSERIYKLYYQLLEKCK